METLQPISAASVILKNSGRGTSSNDQGVFKLELTGFPAILFLQCMGYIRDTIVIESEIKFVSEFKNQKREILLKQSPFQINEVQVKARSTLFEKDPYAIIDFKIVGKRIVALGYKNGNEFRKEILLVDMFGKMLGNNVFKNLDSLYQDCQGNVFAFCSDSVLELRFSRKQISILNGYQRSYISNYIAPVCGISDSLIFLKKSSPNRQYDNYFAVRDTQFARIVYSTGGIMKESMTASLNKTFRSQGAWMISLPAPIATRGDDLAKIIEDGYHRFYDTQFKLQTDYHPVFSKMLSNGKQQLIIDREAATIFHIDENGRIVSEAGIDNKMNNIYFRDVHLDAGTGRIYIEYPQGVFTHFIEINPENGQEIRRFMVREFRHIEKCKFLNDRLYFLYQTDTGQRIKKIYSISI